MSTEGKYPIIVRINPSNMDYAGSQDEPYLSINDEQTLIALQSALGEIRGEDEWVSVKQVYPPTGKSVLISLSSGVIVVGQRDSGDDWTIFTEPSNLETIDTITHWQPLPPAPKLNK